MTKIKLVSLLALVGTAILLTSTATSQPTGAQVTVGEGQTYSGSGTAGSVVTEGGNVTNANLTVQRVTDKWAAFYGQLNTQERLADASGNNFYQWSVTDTTATNANVYAVPSGNATPTTLNDPADPTNILNSDLTSGVDSASNTFNTSATVAGTAATYAAETLVGSSGTYGDFTVGLFENGADTGNPAYVAEVQNDNNGFNDQSQDFQLLVGVGENTAQRSFDFYAEIG